MIYQPAEDSYLLGEQVKKFVKNKSFLDMGSGSGVQSIIAKENEAKSTLAVEINPEALKFLISKGIPTIQSDLFKRISGKFDVIAFNPPYLPRDKREPKDSQLATTGGVSGDETILRFLKEAPKHLNKNGIILILLSSLTPRKRILLLLSKLKLKKRKLSSKRLFMEELEVWKIERKP